MCCWWDEHSEDLSLGWERGSHWAVSSSQFPGEVFSLLSSLLLLATFSFRVYYSISSLSLDAEGKFGADPGFPFKKEKGSIFEQKTRALPELDCQDSWQSGRPWTLERLFILKELKFPSVMTTLDMSGGKRGLKRK